MQKSIVFIYKSADQLGDIDKRDSIIVTTKNKVHGKNVINVQDLFEEALKYDLKYKEDLKIRKHTIL